MKKQNKSIGKLKEIDIMKKQNKSIEILNYWNFLGLRRHSNPFTKVYKQSLKNINLLLKGKFVPPVEFDVKYTNRKFTKAEIMIAIQRFSVAALDRNYMPVNKEFLQKTSLCDFIFSPYGEKKWKSKFLIFLETKPQKVKVIRKNKYPNTSKRIAELYQQETGRALLESDMKFAQKAALCLHLFMKENNKKFKSDLTLKNLTKILVQTVVERFKNNINPSCLSAPFIYTEALIEKLKKARYM